MTQDAMQDSVGFSGFIGERGQIGPAVNLVVNQFDQPLPAYRDEWCFSLEPFDWGCFKPESLQLAYAILRHVTGDVMFSACNTEVFQLDVVAELPRGNWRLPMARVKSFIEACRPHLTEAQCRAQLAELQPA